MNATHSSCFGIACALLLGSCDVDVSHYHRESEPPTAAALKEYVAHVDVESFVAALNDVLRDDPDPQILAFLTSLWQQRSLVERPALLDNELAVVALASMLAQASRNGAIDIDDEQLHAAVRRGLDSADFRTELQAVFGLSIFDDPIDIAALAKKTQSPDDAIYRAAVMGLANMCSQEADAALAALATSLSMDRLSFLREAQRKSNQVDLASHRCPSQ